MTTKDFRDYLLPADSPRILNARGLDPITYSKPILATERAIALNAEWQGRYHEPFIGVTADGTLVDGLFALQDEGFDPAPAVAAMQTMLLALAPEQVEKLSYAVDANEWRGWYNPEIVFNDFGVRLEDMPEAARTAFLGLLATCTSEKGFTKIRQLLSANLYLGEIYGKSVV